MAVSPDRKSILVMDGNDLVTFDLAGQEFGTRIAFRSAWLFRALEVRPDGQAVLVGGISGKSQAGDLRTSELSGKRRALQRIVEPNGAGINDAAYSTDGRWLVTGSLNGTAERRGTQDYRRVGYPMHLDGGVRSVAYHPREDIVVTGVDDGSAVVWLLPSPDLLHLRIQWRLWRRFQS
jgi:WD40 repeat protein